MLNYKEKYQKEVIPAFKKEFGLKNDLAVPKIVKVVINCGIGKMLVQSPNPKELQAKIEESLKMITGQKPKVTRARQSISGFKLRAGAPVGLVVTLRGQKMEGFIDKFIHLVLPRSHDFWGIPLNHFDKKGNLNYGIKEHTVFPEAAEDIKPFGLEVTFVTNAKNREQAIKLFKLLGFPLKE